MSSPLVPISPYPIDSSAEIGAIVILPPAVPVAAAAPAARVRPAADELGTHIDEFA